MLQPELIIGTDIQRAQVSMLLELWLVSTNVIVHIRTFQISSTEITFKLRYKNCVNHVTGMERNTRPVGDDLEHSGTSQDDGKPVMVSFKKLLLRAHPIRVLIPLDIAKASTLYTDNSTCLQM